MTGRFADAADVMRRALELAAQGIGAVEPNPAVGAVLVDDGLRLIAEGYHHRYGGAHAEVEALQQAGERAAGATLFVTLEPCCHQGKTGPCTEAIARAGVRKVVVALSDPFPLVDGKGIDRLRSRGIEVEVGLLADEARRLIAPFSKLVTTGRPWVHAKWAMSLDGKIATASGDSRWISNEASRAIVHRLRGRADAVMIGAATALRDDPLLTARPPGPRIATRIVVDSRAALPITSQLVRTAREFPVLVATSSAPPTEHVRRLQEHGVEVLTPKAQPASIEAPASNATSSLGNSPDRVDVGWLLSELGRRRFTNVVVEGGARLLGSCFDAGQIDEVHVFVAPKLVGGADAPSALGGQGRLEIGLAEELHELQVQRVHDDVYINGRLRPA